MKKYILGISVTIALNCICGQKSFAQMMIFKEGVQCLMNWKVGEVKRYQIADNQSTTKNEIVENKLQTIYDLYIKVESQQDSTYTVSATYKNFSFPKDAKAIDVKMGSIFEGTSFRYKILHTGEFLELINEEELSQHIEKGCNKIVDEMVEPDSVKELTRKILGVFLNNREMAIYKIIEEITMLHTFYGGEYSRSEITISDVEIENLIDPENNFPGQMTIGIPTISPDEKTVTFSYTQKIKDSKEAREILINSIKKLMPDMENKTVDETLFSKFQSNSKLECTFNVVSGWPISLKYMKTNKMDNTRYIQTKQITLMPN